MARSPGSVEIVPSSSRHATDLRPARSGQWEYYFFIDLQGHPEQPAVQTAMHELREACAFFKVLGAYPIDAH